MNQIIEKNLSKKDAESLKKWYNENTNFYHFIERDLSVKRRKLYKLVRYG